MLELIHGVDIPPEVSRAASKDSVIRYLVADALGGIASVERLDAARSPHRAVEVMRRLRYRMTLVTGLRHRAFELVRPLWRWLNI